MKQYPGRYTIVSAIGFFSLQCFLQLGHCAAPGKSETPAAPTPGEAAQKEIPRSVFAIPSNAKEGRNPFFLYAIAPVPVPQPDPGTVPTDLVLNGITSPPKRTAMINGRTFEPGESGEVKLPDGSKILIKCEQIGDDSAIISIDGKRQELRMRFGI